MKNPTPSLWSAREVASALQTTPSGDWEATGVSIDSRSITPGELFIALVGERFNGHHYVAQALDKGASAAIVSEQPAAVAADDPRLVYVPDTEIALQQLGVAARERTQARVVGVTGSVGKTGAKEMLRVALSAVGNTYATKGNLNNHLGVPLSLANMPLACDYAVIEMGMNHAGEISRLSQWARPDVSLITTVDAVHIEFFDSVEGIADAKSEIFDGMGGQGTAVLNADNPHFPRMYQHAVDAGVDRIISFGVSEHALARMLQYSTEGLASLIDASIAGTRLHYRLGAIGRHWGLMSVAVLSVADALEAELPKAAEALQYFHEPEGRGRISELPVDGGHLRLIDDSYNASPAAMEAAFEKMASLRDAEPDPWRTVAVLGDMLELGDRAHDLHVGLAPSLVNNQIDLVFAAGHFMKHLYDALPDSMRGDYDESALKLAPKVTGRLQPQDLVLVKGSHGSQMHQVVEAIEENGRRVSREVKESKDAL